MNLEQQAALAAALENLRFCASCYSDNEPVVVRKSDLMLVCAAAEGRMPPMPADSEGGETD